MGGSSRERERRAAGRAPSPTGRLPSTRRRADADLVAGRVEHREHAHPEVRVRERREPRVVACRGRPGCVDGVDVVGVDEAAARRAVAEHRAAEMQLAALVLDDQVVPLLVRRPSVREPQPAIELCRCLEVAAREEGQRTKHHRDYRFRL